MCSHFSLLFPHLLVLLLGGCRAIALLCPIPQWLQVPLVLCSLLVLVRMSAIILWITFLLCKGLCSVIFFMVFSWILETPKDTNRYDWDGLSISWFGSLDEANPHWPIRWGVDKLENPFPPPKQTFFKLFLQWIAVISILVDFMWGCYYFHHFLFFPLTWLHLAFVGVFCWCGTYSKCLFSRWPY